MLRLIPLLLTVFCLPAKAQIFSEMSVPNSEFGIWQTGDIKDYTGTYKFGFSEAESELRVFIDDSIHAAQQNGYTWRNDSVGWHDTFYTFSNVRIEGNMFFSDETIGAFVERTHENGSSRGLLLFSWSDITSEPGGEYGPILPDDKEVHLAGKFPEASQRLLSDAELSAYSKADLKLMRNEIFARYGYKFIPGGEMDTYFRQQKWYRANYDDVDAWLTEIEQINIKRIRKLEEQ